MKRVLVVAAILFVISPAAADLIPPGTKNIAIDVKITTEKDYPGWVFYTISGSGDVALVKLDAKTPLTIPGSSGVGNGPAPQPGEKRRTQPYRSHVLVAVPKDAVKAYATEKELHAAIDDGKVPGQVQVKQAFSDHDNVKVTDPRKAIVQRFTLEKIDAKDGIVLQPVKDDVKPGEEGIVYTNAPPETLSWWIAGGLLTAFTITTGFFLLRRNGAGIAAS